MESIQLMVSFGIAYLKKNGIGINKFGIEVCYKKPYFEYLLQASQYWEAVSLIWGDGWLQTGYNIRSMFQTGLVPDWWVLWCLQSSDFPGGVIVANNSSRVYWIGIDKFYVKLELTKWNWVELELTSHLIASLFKHICLFHGVFELIYQTFPVDWQLGILISVKLYKSQ